MVLLDLRDQAFLRRADVRDRLNDQRRHIHLGHGIGHDLAHVVTQTGARLVQAGRIQKDILRVPAAEHARDARTRGLRLAGHDGDLLPHQLIGQRGFADIRAADHRDDRGFRNLRHCILP